MFALDVREGIAVNTLQGLDPQTLFPDELRQTGAIRCSTALRIAWKWLFPGVMSGSQRSS